jgi:hypothetical protein
MEKEPRWTRLGELPPAAPAPTVERRRKARLGTGVIGATAAVLLIAAVGAAAQHLRAGQSTNITVRVVGTLGVQMPTLPAGCSNCVVTVPVSSNWNLPPGQAMGVTFLTRLTNVTTKSGTATVVRRSLAKGRGVSSLLVRLVPESETEPLLVTIETQNY